MPKLLEGYGDIEAMESEGGFALFDYGKRNPLNYEAKTWQFAVMRGEESQG